jgi:hypothetical protein
MGRETERKANCSSSSDDKAVVIFPVQFSEAQQCSSGADRLTLMPRERLVQPELPFFTACRAMPVK